MIDEPLTITTHAVFELSANFFGYPDEASSRALDYFSSIEAAVYDGVFQRMRDGQSAHDGPHERDSLMVTTIGRASGDVSLVAWSDTIQAAVDETGATFQTFPPWREDSSLYAWVEARGLGGLLSSQRRALGQLLGREGSRAAAEDLERRRTLSITYLIARAIWTRGLPAPEDYIHAPFHNTFLEFLPDVMAELQAIGFEASQFVNGLI